MKKFTQILLILLFIFTGISNVQAMAMLYEWDFNIDGTVIGAYGPPAADSQLYDYDIDDSSFDWGTGLGILTYEATPTAGDHTFIAFFDHEIDEAINTYYNDMIYYSFLIIT